MSSLSPSAGIYWSKIVCSAESTYEQWLRASPDPHGERFRKGRFSLLEQRVVIMLLKALPEGVKSDAIAARNVSAAALLFRALCRIQPGSASDKSSMLAFVVTPPTAQTSSQALESARKWQRVNRRLLEVRAQLPDPSLRLNGLDSIVKAVMTALPGPQFRVSAWREQNRIDYAPNHEKVDQLTQLYIAELELTTIHAPGTTESPQRPQKQPKLAKTDVEGQGAKGFEKGKGQGKRGSKSQAELTGASVGSEPKSPQADAKALCRGYLTSKGCSYGDNCVFQHQFAEAGKRGLCYCCGSTDNVHRRPECPVANRESGQSSGSGSPQGAKGGKGCKGKDGKGKKGKKGGAAVAAVATDAGSSAAASPETGDAGKATNSSSSEVAAPSTQQVEAEALRILKGLKLAKIVAVPSSAFCSHASGELGALEGGTGSSESTYRAEAESIWKALGFGKGGGADAPDAPCCGGIARHAEDHDADQSHVEKSSCEDVVLSGACALGHLSHDADQSQVEKSSCEDVLLSGALSIEAHECNALKIRGLRCDSVSVSEGILDSGADRILRRAEVEQWRCAKDCSVSFPLGVTVLKRGDCGSLLTLNTEQGVREYAAMLNALPGSTAVDVNGVSLRYLKQGEEEYGLLDGGATNALRQGTPIECRESSQISVELATGFNSSHE